MAFVGNGGEYPERGTGREIVIYHDPIASAAFATGVPVSQSGIGAFPNPGASNLGFGFDFAGAAKGAGTGAAIGTAVPVIGNVVGGIIGTIAGLFGGGGADSTGLSRAPVNNPAFADGLASKWYSLYAGHDAAPNDQAWWKRQIMEDGPKRAFVNFSKALSDSQGKDGMALSAQWEAAGYGDYTVLGPYFGGDQTAPGINYQGSNQSGAPTLPRPNPSPNTKPNIQQAGMGGLSLSPTIILLGVVGIGAFLLLSKRKGAR